MSAIQLCRGKNKHRPIKMIYPKCFFYLIFLYHYLAIIYFDICWFWGSSLTSSLSHLRIQLHLANMITVKCLICTYCWNTSTVLSIFPMVISGDFAVIIQPCRSVGNNVIRCLAFVKSSCASPAGQTQTWLWTPRLLFRKKSSLGLAAGGGRPEWLP